MKLKLLILSLICLSQIDLYSAAVEAYPDCNKMSLQVLTQIDEQLSVDNKSEFESLQSENFALKVQNADLQASLDAARNTAFNDYRGLRDENRSLKIYVDRLEKEKASLQSNFQEFMRHYETLLEKYNNMKDNCQNAIKNAALAYKNAEGFKKLVK